MLLDHLNRYLLSGAHEWMNQAGRAVFPIFALVLGFGLRGLVCERRAARLMLWLALLFAVSELAAWYLVASGVRPAYPFNVLLTLFCGVVLVWARRQDKVTGVVAMGVALLLSLLGEYGPIGALLVYAAYAGRTWAVWALLGVLSVWQLSLVPLCVPALWYVAHWMCGDQSMRSPKMLFGAAYAGQFAAFSLALLMR